jgi:hypothetical protein
MGADSKSIWMIVNTGIRSDLFEVEHRVAETTPDYERRSRDRADILEYRRRTARVHDRRAHTDRRHLDVDRG